MTSFGCLLKSVQFPEDWTWGCDDDTSLLPLTETEKTEERVDLMGQCNEHEMEALSFGMLNLRHLFIRHPGGSTKEVVGYIELEFS